MIKANSSIKSLFFMLITASFCLGSDAYAFTGPSRPLSVFIIDAAGTEPQRIDIFVSLGSNSAAPQGPLEVVNTSGEVICKAILSSRGLKWLVKDLSCLFSEQTIPEIVLVEKRRWGVISHGIAKISFSNGVQIGFLAHIGSEQVIHSRALVSDKDIVELYGKFPAWTLPSQ